MAVSECWRWRWSLPATAWTNKTWPVSQGWRENCDIKMTYRHFRREKWKVDLVVSLSKWNYILFNCVMTHDLILLVVLLTAIIECSVCGFVSRSSVVSLPAGAPSCSHPQGVSSAAAVVRNLHHGHHSSVSLASEYVAINMSTLISSHLRFHRKQAHLHLQYVYSGRT